MLNDMAGWSSVKTIITMIIIVIIIKCLVERWLVLDDDL